MTNIQKTAFPFHELCGALHLHTTCSDGGSTYPVLIETSRLLGLDYIIVTDHMTLSGREKGFEGFHNGLFVSIGYEHNDKNNWNHYLALGTNSVVQYQNDAQGYIDRIREQGGIGFLAHPVELRHYFEKYPPYPWTQWQATGFDGIELWNQMSDWLENLKSNKQFMRLFYPRRFLCEVRKELLERWDEFNRTRFVSGVGGVDAHTYRTRFGFLPFTIFPIKVELKGIRTHLYLSESLPKNDTVRAKQMLLSALKDGKGFISNYRRSDARGAQIFIEAQDGIVQSPGVPDREIMLPATIHVGLPQKARIVLVKNGKSVSQVQSDCADFPVTEKGLYRIEVYIDKCAWIYSNPFVVGRYPLW